MTCRDVCDPCTDGARCDSCGERMCDLNGPEPRVCGTTCRDCDCDCRACQDAESDRRADLLHKIGRES